MGGGEHARKHTQMSLTAVKKAAHPCVVDTRFLPSHRPCAYCKRLPAQPHKLCVSHLATK